mmetsp:Transcript_6923/g.8625  ORF Transcript_6923/g.8625 Transcript_6923/m.8625 type:complete len:103 (-) Transcript_6923:1590-1898(-)
MRGRLVVETDTLEAGRLAVETDTLEPVTDTDTLEPVEAVAFETAGLEAPPVFTLEPVEAAAFETAGFEALPVFTFFGAGSLVLLEPVFKVAASAERVLGKVG